MMAFAPPPHNTPRAVSVRAFVRAKNGTKKKERDEDDDAIAADVMGFCWRHNRRSERERRDFRKSVGSKKKLSSSNVVKVKKIHKAWSSQRSPQPPKEVSRIWPPPQDNCIRVFCSSSSSRRHQHEAADKGGVSQLFRDCRGLHYLGF